MNQEAQPQQVSLPPVVKFVLPAQHAVVILEALGNHGPHKTVFPVVKNFEEQLVAQAIKPVTPQPEDAAAVEAPSQGPALILAGDPDHEA